MNLEFELLRRKGNNRQASYTVLRKGLAVGSLILDEEYTIIELDQLIAKGEKEK